MKKITSLFIAMLIIVVSAGAQSLVNVYQLNENFQEQVAPWGFTLGANTTITIPDIGSPRNNVFQLAVASASGRRISNRVFTPAFAADPGSFDAKLYVEFEWQSGTPTGGNRGFIRLMDGTNIVLAIGTEGTTASNVLHYGNLDPPNQNALVATTLISPVDGNFPRNEWYHVKFKIDFTTKIVDELVITRLSNNFSWTVSNVSFINPSAAAITRIDIEGGRQGGSNGAWTTQIDNLKIYTVKESAGSAAVTINYLDQDGVVAQTPRIVSDVNVGITFTATAADKASFTSNGYYYAYDAAATLADQVVVAAGGSEINLRFRKTPLTLGTYTWTGAASANWNEIDANFSTDGVNALGYQNSNAVVLGAAGVNKAINLATALNIGAENVTIAGDGYAISGTGNLSGTGSVVVNLTAGQSASLNVINNLTGGVVVNGGTLVLQSDAAASAITMADGTVLNLSTGAAFSRAIAGAGVVTVIPTTNNTYSAAVSGVTQLNYELVSAGSVTTAGAFSAMPILNNTVPAGAKIQINNTLQVPAMFGSTISYPNAAISLGSLVDMVFAQNPAADGSTTVAIGELSGVTSSKVRGSRIGRTVTYNVGGLNSNSTFAGTFENFDPDAWANIGTLNLIKSGTGKLTLAGVSTAYVLGSVNVAAGELEVTGTLASAAVPLTVAANATLSGTGLIPGNTTVNGIIKGRLTFGNALALNGTTELNVAGFDAGQFDVLTVTGALTAGGTLNINVTAAPPSVGTQIKLIDAGTVTGAFTSVNGVPEGYSFDPSNGMLTRDFGSSLHEAVGFRIYPTLVTNSVMVDGQNISRISIYNIAGQMVRTITSISERNTINMSQMANGVYLMKVDFADGSVKVQNILLQK